MTGSKTNDVTQFLTPLPLIVIDTLFEIYYTIVTNSLTPPLFMMPNLKTWLSREMEANERIFFDI
jgi:hypothetical protein